MIGRLLSLTLGAVLATTPALAEQVLYMFEQAGCAYCLQWDREVGDAYPLTDEGRAAPLVRINIRDDPPEGLKLAARPVFTPTFVLARDGQELGRIEGYPGEDFFWGLLGQMIATPAVASSN
ncbi:MAG TPA: thioredoxin family protein [Paracoccaceae bacterium]